MKVYKSKYGYEFRIVEINSPSKDGIVNWTSLEFDYIKRNKFTSEQYKIIHGLKLENYLYSPVPEKELSLGEKLAKQYIPLIRPTLEKHKKDATKIEYKEPIKIDWNKIWQDHCENVKAMQAIIVSRRGFSGGW